MEEFGNYNIESSKMIGSGTFGVVHEVKVYNKSKTCMTSFARKCFSPSYNPEKEELLELRERFNREVKFQASCFHPNIVHICMYDLSAEKPWFIMELAESSLEEVLQSDDCVEGSRKLSELEKVNIFKMILSGVNYMHNKGLLHRDLKPLNILKFADGIFKISDFGLVKNLNSDSTPLTQIGQQIGTTKYMAPEIQSGGNYTISSDIYAIGVILEELTLSERYEHIITKCTDRRPTKRYASVQEIINDVNSIGESE
ncbi:protein kinase family protein [Actinobacillus capsulatus]|uniref:protein kinase family protein n=1 Tax=Actinobacillus capsulatus TaxID=717 RepID=UPI000367EC30|nr:protein kinase family protein [Actinobacillus capsulatus]